MQVKQVENGYIVSEGGIMRIARTLEEVFDALLLRFEGRVKDPGSIEAFGTVIILRCKCFQMNSEGLERKDAVNGCSRCSERLAILV